MEGWVVMFCFAGVCLDWGLGGGSVACDVVWFGRHCSVFHRFRNGVFLWL